MAETLSIMTFNCNGLNDRNKRKDFFDMFHKMKYNIYFLQETHLRERDLAYHRASWGYELYIAGHDSNKGGCAILLNNNFEHKVTKVECDPSGYFIFLFIEIQGKKYILINLYGPSTGDNPVFFDTLNNKLQDANDELIIMAGDWNCVQDPLLDRKNYATDNNRKNTRTSIKNLMSDHNLCDVYREISNDKQSFTWRKFNSTKQARLDYFLISETLVYETKSVSTKASYRSDHSPVVLELKTSTFVHGRSFWKFNNSLLYDLEYVKAIKQVITDIKKQYCAQMYNLDNIDMIPNNELSLMISDQIFLETLLFEIRGKTISFATHKKKNETENEQKILLRMETLEKNLNDHNQDELNRLRIELQLIRDKKMQGTNIRSKVRWIAHGEKVSKYFCNMENRHFKEKSIPLLEKEDGSILSSQQEIKNEIESFYRTLYSENHNVNTSANIEDFDCPKLSDAEKNSLEGPIMWPELVETLKKSKHGKSPGPDGFTVEFFQFFVNDLGHFLIRSFNEGLDKEEMSISLRQGSITLIPKENKPKRYAKNLRPISLLSVAYKIASGCIANRLKKVLPTIIHDSQYGFLAGRQISTAVHKIYETLNYAENHQIPGMILSIDIEKAFDSISWQFLLKALTFFNFGPIFIKWIKTFYNNITSCVAVNGQYTSWFPVRRGVRQGDPSSPYLYLICAEVLSLMLRNNRMIKGITLNHKENLLTQFADDTTLSLDGTEQSFTEAIKTISKFAEMSGLKMNRQKTQVIFIGSLKNSNIRYLRDENFVWNPGTWKILGISFTVNIDEIVTINYQTCRTSCLCQI